MARCACNCVVRETNEYPLPHLPNPPVCVYYITHTKDNLMLIIIFIM